MRSGRLWSAVNRPGDERKLLLDDHHRYSSGPVLLWKPVGRGWGSLLLLCPLDLASRAPFNGRVRPSDVVVKSKS